MPSSPRPKVHKPGVKIYDSVVVQLPGLLKELLAAPAAKVSEHPPIPEAPGIYLFSEPGGAERGGEKAIYVGQTRKLRSRLKNHALGREEQPGDLRLPPGEGRRRGGRR
jgi:hypothetical protein